MDYCMISKPWWCWDILTFSSYDNFCVMTMTWNIMYILHMKKCIFVLMLCKLLILLLLGTLWYRVCNYLIMLTILGDEYKLWTPPLCSFFHCFVTSTFLGLNILHCTFFLNTFNPCCSLRVRDQVLQPHKTTGKIVVLCVPLSHSLHRKTKVKRFWTQW
jgi:hypothetical protein